MKRSAHCPRPKRSSSKKSHNRSPSAPQEDDYIVTVLNNRSISDRDILITRQQYEDLKREKKELREAREKIRELAGSRERDGKEKEEWEGTHQRLQAKISSLEDRLRLDSGHIEELTYINAKLESELRTAQAHISDLRQRNDTDIANLKSSLGGIETSMRSRVSEGVRALDRCIKIIESDVTNLLDFSPSFPQRPQILTLLHESLQSAYESRVLLFPSDSDENFRQKDEGKRLREGSASVREYQITVEKMREQTRMIRERLRLLEGDGAIKKTIEDYEGRLNLLESEKLMLTENSTTLQSTLSEQCLVIEHLKSIISSLVGPLSPPKTPKAYLPSNSPARSLNSSLCISPDPTIQSKLSSPFILKSGHKPRDITLEIEALDRDIEVLQSSLQKALDL